MVRCLAHRYRMRKTRRQDDAGRGAVSRLGGLDGPPSRVAAPTTLARERAAWRAARPLASGGWQAATFGMPRPWQAAALASGP